MTLTKVSKSGGMIIQAIRLRDDRRHVRSSIKGETTFGFFSKQALANQVGIRDAALWDRNRLRADRLRRPIIRHEIRRSPTAGGG